MKNMTELRDELSSVFQQLKAGEIAPKEAAELNNCAGKIINSTKVELEYFALKKETPFIPFLEQPNDDE